MGIRSHHQQYGLGADLKQAVKTDGYNDLSTQWALRTIRASGHDVTIVSAYLAPGVGLAGTNLITLGEIGA